VTLSLLPLAMRMAGPREALWHALIRRQYGATHFIVGRDHAGPGNAPSGQPWYPPLAAQELLARHAEEIGLTILPFPAQVYAANRQRFISIDTAQPGDEIRDVSGTELRSLLERGEPIPAWYTFPGVATILRERHPPAAGRGAVVFFTGLSGAGKSTLAQALAALIAERSARAVTLLDGDEVRRTLSKGLGFSRADRDANIERIGWVAAEIARHRGLAIAAPIAPYAAARAQARRLVEAAGGIFLEVHVATPIEVCEARDAKGLYAQARAGKLSGFTGIDDPYETPEAPDLRIDASSEAPRDLAQRILDRLESAGLRP
jgi:sulfate adenylyltransferase